MTKRKLHKPDVYSRITDKIIADLEQGRPSLDEALERAACGEPHQQAPTTQRPAVQRHQCPHALVRC